MYPDNHFYGHSHTLRRYLGVGEDFRFNFGLQHGWTTGPGHAFSAFERTWTKAVWAKRNLDQCALLGDHNVVAIGSPYLYLQRLERERATQADPPSSSLLAFPSHGWEKRGITYSVREYAESLERLERDGFGPITVCMYWKEHAEEHLRAEFTQRGWQVVTAGHRENNPSFLQTIHDLVLAHRYATSNRLQTACFYAIASGRKFFLHGPVDPMAIPDAKGPIDDPSGERFESWVRREFPKIHYDSFGDRTNEELAEVELGSEYILSREGLRDLADAPWVDRHWDRSLMASTKRELRRMRRRLGRVFGGASDD